VLDSGKKRTVLIDHLPCAIGLADELGDATTAYLMERAIDEATPRQVKQSSRIGTKRCGGALESPLPWLESRSHDQLRVPLLRPAYSADRLCWSWQRTSPQNRFEKVPISAQGPARPFCRLIAGGSLGA
jgi:hypothetical protein